jgi:hypothetical protein
MNNTFNFLNDFLDDFLHDSSQVIALDDTEITCQFDSQTENIPEAPNDDLDLHPDFSMMSLNQLHIQNLMPSTNPSEIIPQYSDQSGEYSDCRSRDPKESVP